MVWKNVQGLRGIAALLVVFAHVHDFSDRVAYQPLFRMFAPLGACGVGLFFVISGFIMMTVHWHDFNALDSSRRFLLRRWFTGFTAILGRYAYACTGVRRCAEFTSSLERRARESVIIAASRAATRYSEHS